MDEYNQLPALLPVLLAGFPLYYLLLAASTSLLLQICHSQGLAVGEYDLEDAPDRLAILHWFYRDGDFISRLKGLFSPATLHHIRRVIRLRCPMCDVAAIILHIEFQEAMGIGPKPFRDRPLHGNFFPSVKRRIAMVCGQRG